MRASPPRAANGVPVTIPTVTFAAGTLRYTKQTLYLLFFYLLWNDMCLMLMENVAPQLTPLLLKDHGATNQQIALYMSTLAGTLTVWINPVFSTWSDRHRGPHGRRRPFLLAVTPFCALFLVLIPFMPDLAPWLHGAVGASSLIGACYVGYFVFNSVLLALFSYYYWDVVPEIVLGRFTALSKVVATISVFIWNYFLFGLAAAHMKAVFVGTSVFFVVVYTLSVWRVKEGDYPPPAPMPRTGPIGWLRSYCRDCFSQPSFCWIFAASAVFQIGNIPNVYQIFLYRDQLHLDLDTIGKMRSFPSLGIVVLGYTVGTLIDRWNPLRLLAPSMLFFAMTNLVFFFFVQGPWSLLLCTSLNVLAVFALGITQSVMYVECYPRAKLGQFCSANALIAQIVCFSVAVPIGKLMDWVHNYRYAFLVSACCEIVSAFMFAYVYYLWRHHRREPVPELVHARGV